MAFAGVSVIADGKLLQGSTAPSVNAGAASGYHLFAVEGYSQTFSLFGSIKSRSFTIGGHSWQIFYYPMGSHWNPDAFIYGDSLPAPTDEEDGVLFQHLLVAADRYGLRRLRAMCEKRLCEHIQVGTAATILALAEQHRCNRLKDACYEFLSYPTNLSVVQATDGFDHLCRSSPSAMKDLIAALVKLPRSK